MLPIMMVRLPWSAVSMAPNWFPLVALTLARVDICRESPIFLLDLVETCPLPGAEFETCLLIGLGLLFKRPFVLTIGLMPRWLIFGLEEGPATRFFCGIASLGEIWSLIPCCPWPRLSTCYWLIGLAEPPLLVSLVFLIVFLFEPTAELLITDVSPPMLFSGFDPSWGPLVVALMFLLLFSSFSMKLFFLLLLLAVYLVIWCAFSLVIGPPTMLCFWSEIISCLISLFMMVSLCWLENTLFPLTVLLGLSSFYILDTFETFRLGLLLSKPWCLY